jgi:hypothetical protein
VRGQGLRIKRQRAGKLFRCVSLAGIEPVGFRVKSDLRIHQAIVQPRLCDCLMVTQITLRRCSEVSFRRRARRWSPPAPFASMHEPAVFITKLLCLNRRSIGLELGLRLSRASSAVTLLKYCLERIFIDRNSPKDTAP